MLNKIVQFELNQLVEIQSSNHSLLTPMSQNSQKQDQKLTFLQKEHIKYIVNLDKV